LDGNSHRDLPLELPLRVAWVSEVPGMIAQNSPVVFDGKVYLGFRAEKDAISAGVMAFDARTGDLLWHRGLNGGVAYAPLAVDGVLIANALNDSVYGFDRDTGDLVWSLATPEAIYVNAAPIGDSNGVLISSKPYCYYVSPLTGEIIWRSEYIGLPWNESTYSAAAMTSSQVFFNTFGALGLQGGLDILDRTSGSRIVPQIPGVFRAPAVVGDSLVIGGGNNQDDQYLTIRDYMGNELVSGAEKIGRGMGGVAVAHGIAVTAGEQGAIVAFSIESGEQLWSHSVEEGLLDMCFGSIGGRVTQACPAIADRTVFVGSIDGNLYALDLDTGEVLWSMNLGMPIASSAALSGNMLYVGCSDGNLYAFKGNSDFHVSGFQNNNEDQTHIWLRKITSPVDSGRTIFEWHLPSDAPLELCVYDIRGRLVSTLETGEYMAGIHRTTWDGKNGYSQTVASGVYFARLSARNTVLTRKVIIVR